MAATLIPGLLTERVDGSRNRPAFLVPDGERWREETWGAVGRRVENIAHGLRALGLEAEQRCAILSGTRLEWILADLGILCAGGATTTVYPSSSAEQTAYILRHAQARFAFAENAEQVAKIAARRAELPDLEHVISFEGAADGDTMTLRALEDRAHATGGLRALADAVRPDALATLIYTSGTTGRPKGVELVHSCWAYEAEAIDDLGILGEDDVQLLWLPLAHSFGKVLEAAQLRVGFVTAIDGRVDRLVDNLAQVRPTFVAAVPRVFEKVHARIFAQLSEPGVRASLLRWALGIGREVSQRNRAGRRPGPLLSLQHRIADALVLSKLRARFGDRLRFFISGSAPLQAEIAEEFHAFGVLVLEGYGLTETSAATTVNLPHRHRFGTVGPPLPGTEIAISPDDGEILIRGPGVMRGYHHDPETTAEALDADGWLHTGDVGQMVDGFLRVTDRKKELIKTSGGKYVAPQAIEGRLRSMCPFVTHALVHGDRRKYCVALLALDEEAVRGWARHHDVEAPHGRAVSELPQVRELVGSCVERLNAGLERHETIKRFAFLPDEPTLEAGELTPSLKLRRRAVEDKHRALLDSLYER